MLGKKEGVRARIRNHSDGLKIQSIHRQEKRDHHCPIICMGGTTSALQNFLQLLNRLPVKMGIAFVCIPQDQPCNVLEIINAVTDMPVVEVRENSIARANHIYVVAAEGALTVVGGVLAVVPRQGAFNQQTMLDSFFRALAIDKGSQAIGLILSGDGSDGAQGLKEIKAFGGITFAQEPSTAEQKKMPLSAIEMSVVDYVLSPGDMISELVRITQALQTARQRSVSLGSNLSGEESIDRVLVLLRKSSGINFADYKQLTIKRRLRRRMALHKMDSLDDYIIYLYQNDAELIALQQDMLINVTSFFREAQAFESLKTAVFPAIMTNTSENDTIRLWVPGCSTGEEAYSMAIVILEFLEERSLQRKVQIFATDISEMVISKARAGIYPASSLSAVCPERIKRFFVKVEQGYQVRKTIRDACVFAVQDIGTDPPISRVHLISCRNVMIYFGSKLQKKMFPIFHYALKQEGFLMLGASESIGLFADLFELVDKKYRIYAKKTPLNPVYCDMASSEQAASIARYIEKDQIEDGKDSYYVDVQKLADRIVLDQYTPAGVLIDSKLDIVQFRGRTGNYFEPAPGEPSLNLMKMVKEGLLLGLRSAINQARQKNGVIRKEGLLYIKNEKVVAVHVEVIPIKGPFKKGEHFLILFLEETRNDMTVPRHEQAKESSDAHFYEDNSSEIQFLKQDIAHTKEHLQAVIDEHEAVNENLRYAYEEIQSSNEELQSMNEEMETSKEELQSTNEELMSLNEELQSRNMQLNSVNNDMHNLLRSITIPVLILSNELHIRRFNSVAEKLLNLIGSDVGRPFNNIKPNVEIPNWEVDILDVLDTLVPKIQEVQDRWGNWYSMQIRPYKTIDNKIEGVMITFVDIHGMKKSFEEAQTTRDYAEAIVDAVRQPLLLLDGKLRVKTVNKAYCQFFRIVPGEISKQLIFQIQAGLWDRTQMRRYLQDILQQDAVFADLTLDYHHPERGKETLSINARRIVTAQSQNQLILMTFEMGDRAERKSVDFSEG